MTATADQTGHSDVVTEGIRVRVGAQYLPDQSDPSLGRYSFVYRVVISNEGDRWAKLRARHWVIRDADNELEEVRGPGVVGYQPEIAPGESFDYVSGCPLRTPWGTMEGSFEMVREDGSRFQAQVGRFFLAPTVAPISKM
ncbi:MAG: Co2+/Mg2+ efflux protein ApaG [Planctomycetes bacterium]|nr:Co2+/Mg2+ efflux protein ApaG [Planctomycetota bacterium]MBL7009243.1 Co2+/Mg2+ efflux protein ApaG [Planctomycetota bacterium]